VDKLTLSICLITYNQAKYIRQSIDSILMQKTNFKWELIIADDYSMDGTREIIKEYKKKFPDLIKLILQKKNFGPEKNWLDLMASPKTKYVLYTEGDDYFIDPNKLQKQIDYLEAHKEFSMCFHPVKVIYEDASRPDGLFPPADRLPSDGVIEFKDLLASNIIQTNSAMYRWRFNNKNIKSTFPKNIVPGDWFLHLLHAQTGKIGYINKVMSVYRRHPGALWWESSRDVNKIWAKYGVNHLAMYDEVLKLCNHQENYIKIVNKNIRSAVDSILSIKNEDKYRILTESMVRLPHIIIQYMEELRQSYIDDEKIILKLSEELNTKTRSFDELDVRMNLILNSRSWKTAQRLSKARARVRRQKH
jgi:glycosyltransferase involved in cell wall biosynthesis